MALPVRTYVDAGVLIAAARGEHRLAEMALDVLDDPSREFVASDFLRLEVLPKAMFNKREAEAAFYQTFFEGVSEWALALDAVVSTALDEACSCGMSAIDGLHVAAASLLGAQEMITTEKESKPMFRTRRLRMISIDKTP